MMNNVVEISLLFLVLVPLILSETYPPFYINKNIRSQADWVSINSLEKYGVILYTSTELVSARLSDSRLVGTGYSDGYIIFNSVH